MSISGAVPGAGLQRPPGTDRPHSPTQHPSAPYSLAVLSWNSSDLIHKEKEKCPKRAQGPVSLSSAGWCSVCSCTVLFCYGCSSFSIPLSCSNPFIPPKPSLLQPSPKHCPSLCLQTCPVPPVISNLNPTGFIPTPTDFPNFAWPFLPDS